MGFVLCLVLQLQSLVRLILQGLLYLILHDFNSQNNYYTRLLTLKKHS